MEQKKKIQTKSKLLTLHELISQGQVRLGLCNKTDANIDAELIALHILGYTKLERILNAQEIISSDDTDTFWNYIAKRCSGVPLQYITNEQEFMGLPFYVDENVLIPRQDTETLVEKLIEISRDKQFKNIIEIGVGSGCISISLAKFMPDAHIVGIDISPHALEIAKKNSRINKVESRIKWIEADILNNYRFDGKVDLIVSNPPYITTKDCSKLEEDVRDYEPMLALDGGEDGLIFYREITKQAKNHLVKGGVLAYEIGYNQGEDVRRIMDENGFEEIEVIKDLVCKDRIVLGISKR